jgi:hypothetical protein
MLAFTLLFTLTLTLLEAVTWAAVHDRKRAPPQGSALLRALSPHRRSARLVASSDLSGHGQRRAE